jgi:hypothetical protein
MVAHAEKESASPDNAGGTLQKALRSTRRQTGRAAARRRFRAVIDPTT